MWDKWKELSIKCYYPKTLTAKQEILNQLRNHKQDEKFKNCIIYIEDPTGKTEEDYQSNYVFQSSIVDVIDHLRLLKSSIIITMRDTIFQKTKQDIEGYERLQNAKSIGQLDFGSSAYEFLDRKEILLRWANKMHCNWLNDKKLRDVVIDEPQKEKLPTPMRIYYFVLATGMNSSTKGKGEYYDITSPKLLIQIIHRISKRIAEEFAHSIRKIQKDKNEFYKVLYVCFAFFSSDFPKAYVKRIFNQIGNLTYSDTYYKKSFFKLAEKYFQGVITSSPYVKFVHPSFSEACSMLLTDDKEFEIPNEEIQGIFSKILSTVLGDVMWTLPTICTFIIKYFNEIDSNTRVWFLNLFTSKYLQGNIVSTLCYQFQILPEKIKVNVLNLIENNDEIIIYSARDLLLSLTNLPPLQKDNLFSKLLKHANNNESVTNALVYAIFDYYEVSESFDKLSSEQKNYLFNIFLKHANNNEKLVNSMIHHLSYRFDILPDYMKLKLFSCLELIDDERERLRCISKLIFQLYDKLPEELIEKLYEKINNNKAFLKDIVMSIPYDKNIYENFLKLPYRIKETLIEKMFVHLDVNQDVAERVLIVMLYHLNYLRQQQKDGLFRKLLEYADKNEE